MSRYFSGLIHGHAALIRDPSCVPVLVACTLGIFCSFFGELTSPPLPPLFPRSEVRVGAVGSAGAAITGGMALGWNMVGVLAEGLPWIGVAYHMLNQIADSVDTRNAMQVSE